MTKDEFVLDIDVRISHTEGYRDVFSLNQKLTVTADDMLGLFKILTEFHELAKKFEAPKK